MNRLTKKTINNSIHSHEPTEYGNDLDRTDLLGEYEDLEEQGLLIKLPCKVGDIVYKVNKASKNVREHEIIKIEYTTIDNEHFTMQFTFKNYDCCFYHHFGKTVFLTREEAEKALKESEER